MAKSPKEIRRLALGLATATLSGDEDALNSMFEEVHFSIEELGSITATLLAVIRVFSDEMRTNGVDPMRIMQQIALRVEAIEP